MGSNFSVDQFTSELSRRGIEVEGIEELIETYNNNRHEDEAKLFRENVITLLKQFDRDTKDEETGKGLLALSEKDRNRPSEQKRIRKLLRRRQHTELEDLVMELEESHHNLSLGLFQSFPPIHPCDTSVDVQVCNDVVTRLCRVSSEVSMEIVRLIVEMRR